MKIACSNRQKQKLFSVRTKLSHKKQFSENQLSIEMNKTKVKRNEPVYIGVSILDIRKTEMYKFW